MYYKRNDLNYDERKLNEKISDLINWAKKNGRQDIVLEASKTNVVTTYTDLRNYYYKLHKMRKGTPNIAINTEKPTQTPPTMENNTPPNPSDNTPEEKPSGQSSSPSNDPTSFDPLLGANPKQRDYTAGMPSGGASPSSGGASSIPEPNFQGGGGQGGAFGVPPDQKDKRFEQTQDLPPNEKKRSSEQLARVLIETYSSNIPALFAALSKVSPAKLQELASSGNIDLNVVLDVPPDRLTVTEYFEASNKQIDSAFAVTPEWKEGVYEYLVRILQKRNWGMTDEQGLMWMVGSHLVQCTIMTVQTRKSNDRLINHLITMTTALRENGSIPNAPTPPPPSSSSSTPPPPPPPPTPPTPSEPMVEAVVAEEFHYDQPDVYNESQAIEPFEPARQMGSRGGRNTPPPDESEDMPVANNFI